MGTRGLGRAIATLSIIGLAVAGCQSGGASPSPSAAPASPSASPGTAIAVTLQEWAVVPASASAPAGVVTFTVTNNGPEDLHEFVVMRTDLSPAALPTDATGKVSESGTGIERVVDEIEDIEVGQTKELVVELAAGKYVLLCNIYDETEQEAHYKMGMVAAFEASG